ncbi:Ku protein [Alcaligenaceae bacterium]|nr:Ku protein [Alcaligenaceae bacterium]
MAAGNRRSLWKGAISFGLVHIPVALYSATESQGIDFDWLDERSMEPVGYKRVNKVTGKEVRKEHIVKGIEYEDGQYVVLSPEEIAAAYPRTTQTVEIETFVPIDDIPFAYLERPYYLAPVNKGAKVYALLREVLAKNDKAGIAKVVIHTRQHLAIVMACGRALILNLMRWESELRGTEDLNLPEKGIKANGLSPKELAMAEQLVSNMSGTWAPTDFSDSFREQILLLVKEKLEAGDIHAVASAESSEETAPSARIYDLTEMLQRSLNKGTGARKTAEAKPAKARAPAGGKAAPRKAAKAAPRTAPSGSAKPARKSAAKTAVKSAAKKAAAAKPRSTPRKGSAKAA